MSNQILITKNDLDSIKSDIDTLKQEKNQLENLGSVGPLKDDAVNQLKDKYQSNVSVYTLSHRNQTKLYPTVYKHNGVRFSSLIRTG